jgi:hypothetical protein
MDPARADELALGDALAAADGRPVEAHVRRHDPVCVADKFARTRSPYGYRIELIERG